MTEYLSATFWAASGTTTTSYTAPASSSYSDLYVRFMGATAVTTSDTTQRTATSGYTESMSAKSNTVTLPAVDSGETLLAATIYMYVKNPDTNAAAHTLNNCYLYINNLNETDDDTNYDLDVGESHTYSYDITEDYDDYEGKLANIYSSWIYQTEPRGQSVWCTLTYQDALFTGPATTTCNGTSACYNGTLDEGTWSGWIALPSTFITGDGESNDITYEIGGNLYAGVQLKFNYITTATVEDYVIIDSGDSYTEYDTGAYGYATTTCNATGWPTTTLEYGNGSIVLEFTENLGVTVPATTWTTNQDIFWFTTDYEPNKIGTVVQSRGTKFSGGTMYSLMSDWATNVFLYEGTKQMDTYLARDAAAGETTIYTVTQTSSTNIWFDSAVKIMIAPGKNNQEVATIIAKGGSLPDGVYFTLQDALTYDHYAYEEMINLNGAWKIYGAATTAWYNTMVSQYGEPSGGMGSVDPAWPVLFGNEIIYIGNVAIGVDCLWINHDSSNERGSSGIAYSHYSGCPVYCVPTVGVYPKSDSMYAAYGVGEVYLNPLGIVDNNTLDIYCYNALMNSTGNATNARGSIPACNLPATVSIGDWVNIQMSKNEYTWLSGWGLRQTFVVANSGSELTNYQHKITVHRASGSSSGNDVYILDRRCNADYSDIRFTNSDGDLLDYWIESQTSLSADIWVELDVVGNGNNTFYMYYLNLSAGSYSDGEDTFPFFDDFPGSALDTTTNWDVASGSVTVTGGECTISSGKIESKTAVTGPLILRGRIKYTNANRWKNIGWCKSGAGDAHLFHAKNTGTAMVARSNNNAGIQQEAADLGNYCDNAYHTIELAAVSSSSFKYYVDGSLGATLTYDIGTSLKIQFEATTSDIIADWILIRKYAATEPTISSWTTESVTEITQDTFAYRLVGWEYDQMKGLFNLEFGAPDDYYMSNDVKYKGAVDVSLSLL